MGHIVDAWLRNPAPVGFLLGFLWNSVNFMWFYWDFDHLPSGFQDFEKPSVWNKSQLVAGRWSFFSSAFTQSQWLIDSRAPVVTRLVNRPWLSRVLQTTLCGSTEPSLNGSFVTAKWWEIGHVWYDNVNNVIKNGYQFMLLKMYHRCLFFWDFGWVFKDQIVFFGSQNAASWHNFAATFLVFQPTGMTEGC